MKKLNVVLIILLLIAIIALSIVSVTLYNTTKSGTEEIKYYGQRGNVKDSTRIEFLSKNEELLVGMIPEEYSEEEKNFSEEDMLNFALYVAKFRYEKLLPTQLKSGKSLYRIDIEIVDDIIKEFFGMTSITYSLVQNDYYSSLYNAFLFDEKFEKSMWFYPVSEEISEEEIKVDADDNESKNEQIQESEEIEKEQYTIITADSIYINETKNIDEIKEIKYNGKYNEEDVEYTIRLKFDSNGYLVSYQYLKNE